jgi:hypothetical protein
MTTAAAAPTCAQCHRAVPRVDGRGRCSRCYLREYRKARRERDPSYKPWQSRKRVRVSITLGRDVRTRLDGIAAGERSALVERLLRDALDCAVLVVGADGKILQAEGTAYAEDPRVHLGKQLEDVFEGNEYILAGFRAALAGRRLSNEMVLRGRRWSVRWAPLRDAARRVHEVIAVGYRLGEAQTEDPRRS